MIYEGYEDHRGRTGQTLVFFIFLLTVLRIRMFFSLKHSASQGESSLKISARFGFAVSEELGNKHTNKQTHLLISCCFSRVIGNPTKDNVRITKYPVIR